jgi:cell division transport system ATP-binding protein
MNLLFHIARDFNTTILMATHDYIVVQKYPARLIRTERGKVIDNATITIE